jgi:hypothetical protein
MVDQDSCYRAGRGVPPYLLCRNDSGSSIYSDGASRIFAPSRSITSEKDTDYSSVSLDSRSVSSINTLSTDIASYATSNSLARTTFENNSGGVGRSVSDKTRTIGNESRPMNTDNQSTYQFSGPFHPVESGPNRSFAPTLSSLNGAPVVASYFNEHKYRHGNIYDTYYGGHDSNTYTDPGQMFTPYVPYLTDNEEEQRRDKSPG